jgi:hypothetical protein
MLEGHRRLSERHRYKDTTPGQIVVIAHSFEIPSDLVNNRVRPDILGRVKFPHRL